MLHDLRIGLRVLLKEKSFLAISVLVLALGIAGVTAQFAVINSALIRGLPFPEPDRLVRITTRDPSWAPDRTRNLFARDLLDWSREQKSFVGLTGYYSAGSFIVTIRDVPQRFSGSHVAGPLFALLGVKPALGRDFTADDNRPEAPRVAIISDALWKSDFDRDPAILGRAIRLNGKSATVVGVMPPGFSFPREQLWMPMFNEYPRGDTADWTGGAVNVLGRLKPGVSLDEAAAELTIFARRAAETFPKSNRDLTEIRVEPLLNTFVPRDARQVMWIMLGAVAAVLLIACLNVMNMQFARATRRARELAVRSALGASRARLVTQMLAESLLVAGAGCAAGVVLSNWAIDLYGSSGGGTGLPAWMQFEIDPVVLLFTLAATGGAVVVSGLLPAFVASRADALDALKAGGRGHTSALVGRVTGSLVVGQIALTAALLVASLLLVKSVASRYALDFGYNPESVLAGRMNFEAGYRGEAETRAVQRRLLDHLRASPHFTHAAFSSRRNSLLTNGATELQLEGREERLRLWVEFVSDGYFATLGLRPLAGREFELSDTPEKPMPAIVNATLAKKYFPGQSALGRRLRFASNNASANPWCIIVGVVPDTLMQGPMDATGDGAGVFFPSTVIPQTYATLVVRGRSASPAQLIEPLRREILRIDPNLAIYAIETPKTALRTQLAQVRVVTRLFAVFGAVAILLSAVGLYGLASFSVNQRTQEFGIRLALGALPRQIMEMVLRQGIARLMLGGGLGLGLAFAFARVLGSANATLLYKVNPRDPTVYALVLVILALATLLACLIPARRATKVDPMIALRAE